MAGMLLLFYALTFLILVRYGDCEGSDVTAEDDILGLGTEEIEPAYAVLFPPLTITIGVVAFYLLTRFAKGLPYTAVMFLLGTLMGITAVLGDFHDHMNESIRLWIGINSEVLLLVFLPGLIFKDAMGQNVHLFSYALPQLLIFAFPMVLAGTVLTALVAHYVFPYGWSFNLAMTFGSILAATDPVAVAALLEEVGAPPRLKVHIAGEALLNDGSAIVFFSIFSERFFHELGIDGFGEEVDLAKGVGLFCRKAFGGVAVGIFFGCGLLLILYVLNRRFNREENVFQTTSVLAVAYLNYYVADFVLSTSGVIATVTAGILVKLLGRAMVNDTKLLEDFNSMVEHILNTILFTLGGVVWGAAISNGETLGIFQAKDWGYLILLYVFLQLIRALQFVVAYPITKQIGLKTNWKETSFQIYGGLRGAVGIALALALDNDVAHETGGQDETEAELLSTQLFAMVGGIAFMTLVINGPTAGPLLRKLGLADSTEIRKRITDAYETRFRSKSVDDMVKLLTQNRFKHVNFAFVRHHVPYLEGLTREQLFSAVERLKEVTPSDEYTPPHLKNILPYMDNDNNKGTATAAVGPNKPNDDNNNNYSSDDEVPFELDDHTEHTRRMRIEQRTKNRKARARRVSSNMRYMMGGEPLSAQELRILFISILRSAYEQQILDGELERQHVLTVSLDQSLEFAVDAVSNGEPIKDWEFLTLIHKPIAAFSNAIRNNPCARLFLNSAPSKRSNMGLTSSRDSMFVERSMAVMAAHRSAQKFLVEQFEDVDRELSEAGKVVISESNKQYNLAEAALKELDPKVVEVAASHKFCKILLNMAISHMEKLVTRGLLKDAEAEHYVGEIEGYLDKVLSCEEIDHPGEKHTDAAPSPAAAAAAATEIADIQTSRDEQQQKNSVPSEEHAREDIEIMRQNNGRGEGAS